MREKIDLMIKSNLRGRCGSNCGRRGRRRLILMYELSIPYIVHLECKRYFSLSMEEKIEKFSLRCAKTFS
jgi:hypothetical protein